MVKVLIRLVHNQAINLGMGEPYPGTGIKSESHCWGSSGFPVISHFDALGYALVQKAEQITGKVQRLYIDYAERLTSSSHANTLYN